MAAKPTSKEELKAAIAAYTEHRGLRPAARALNLQHTTLLDRLDQARRAGMFVPDINATPDAKGRREIDLTNGCGIIGSDAHYFPGPPSTAHRAFCYLAKKLKPDFVVLNGDALDLSRLSRHPPPGWTRMPETKDEFEVTTERMGELAIASGKAKKFWPWGNHDQRWEIYLATNAAEVSGVKGMRLLDHFPDWEPCWSLFVNNRPGGLVVKHRLRGGKHAASNNALWAGRSIVTGHLHAQTVREVTDYNGTRYGVDAGCMADIYGPQFSYLEDSPRDWRAGLVVVTFRDGFLMPPELVRVIEPGAVHWRGEILDV